MFKKLRSLALAAAMLLPFASQAQTVTCAGAPPDTAYNAETYSGTTSDFPGSSYYNYSYSEVIIPAEVLDGMGEIQGFSFWPIAATYGSYYNDCDIYMAHTTRTDLSSGFIQDPVSFELVYSGSINFSAAGWRDVVFDTPFAYDGESNVVLAVNRKHGSYGSGSNNFRSINASAALARYVRNDGSAYTIGTISGGTAVSNGVPYYRLFGCPAVQSSCARVTDLAYSNLTSNGVTLTWSDTNASATYTILRNGDTVARNVTGTSYTFNDLAPITGYAFGVIADCGGGEVSRAVSITLRTPCGLVGLPYTMGFEPIEIDNQNTSYNMPYCWARYNNSNGSSNYYPYANTGSYARTGTGYLQVYSYTTSAYGDTVMAIMPQIDVTNFPMNNNQLNFFARTGSSTQNILVEVGTMTDPDDPNTFVVDQVVTVSGDEYAEYEALLGVNGNGAYPAIRMFKQATTTTFYGDDFTIDVRPTCLRPSNLTTERTSSTLSFSWSDAANTGATYSLTLIQGTDTTYVTTPDTFYTFNNLPANTAYSLELRALCSATDSSRELTTMVYTRHDGHEITAFNLTGTARRDAVVFDTVPRNIIAPVWYTDNLAAAATITWTVSSGASVFIDTTGDGSFTCQVTATSIRQYLQMNVPITLRVKADDTLLFSDYTLTLQTESCVVARNLTLFAERIRYTATWECPDTTVTDFLFINSDTRLDKDNITATPITVQGRSYTVEDLTRETKYYVYLKTPCDTVWIEDSIVTKALGNCDEVTIADGTNTSGYVPLYGNYAERPQRIQSVYPASMLTDMLGMTIDSLHYFVSSGSSSSWGSQTWEVSLGVTSLANLSSGWVDTAELTRVYTGTLNASVAAGMSIRLDQPFTYTGGNLVVQFVQRVPNNYTSCYFYGMNSSSNMSVSTSASRYAYPSSSSSLWTDGGTTTAFLPKFSFMYCQAPNACPEVTSIAADSITNTSATINWTAADADYCVGYEYVLSTTALDTSDMTGVATSTLPTSTVSYNATGLTPEQDYFFYIKTLCNGSAHDEGTSGWATVDFHTFPTCRTPEILNVEPTGKHTAQMVVSNTGTAIGQANNYGYYVSTSLLTDTELENLTATVTGLTSDTIVLDNLASETTYYIYVQNACPAENCLSPWSQPDSVTMPAAMPAPINFMVGDVAHNAMTSVWERDTLNFADETAWRVAIALHGQQPTEWQTVSTTAGSPNTGYNIFIGLTVDTAYDIYLCAFDVATGATSDTVVLDSIRTAHFPGNCGDPQGNGISTNYYFLPGYYGFQYSAGLYDIDQDGSLTSLSVDVKNNITSTGSQMSIWVKAVDAAFALDATTPFDTLKKEALEIYNGSADGFSIGWTEFVFPTALSVQQGQQLLVLTSGVGCTTSGGCSHNVNGTAVTGKFRYYATDGTAPTGEVKLTTTDNRPNMMLCYERTDSCLSVENLYLVNLDANSADIVWQPGNEETEWQYILTCDTASVLDETLAQNITSTNLAATDLLRNTTYHFYIRPVCSDTLSGSWTGMTFTTPYVDYYYDVTVTVNDTAMGSVESLMQVIEGTDTVLVAEPATGFHLENWALADGTILGTDDSLAITVDSNMSIVATFAPNMYAVEAVVNPANSGNNISGMPTDSVVYNTVVTLTAEPADGYHFVDWSNGETTETISVTVVSDTTLTANFAINTYTVTATVTPAGSGSVSGVPNAAVEHGTTVTLTATATAGNRFLNWTDGNGNLVSTDAVYTFNVTEDVDLTANFEVTTVTVTGLVEGMGQVYGSGTYEKGATVTLIAQANEYWRFVRWSTGETTPTLILNNVTSDITVTAIFEEGTIGIDDIDLDNVDIFALDSKVVVRGAEGQHIYLFDVNGRCLTQRASANETEEITVSNTGVYLVKVGNAPAKRVVVVR